MRKSEHPPTAPGGKPRGGWKLAGLACLFLGPLIIAWLMYAFGFGQPGAQAVYGTLLEPVVTLPADPLTGGEAGAAAPFREHWSLIVLTDDGCASTCTELLAQTRQVRLALGRHRERVRRVLLYSGGEPDLAELRRAHPGLVTYGLNDEAGRAVQASFPPDPTGRVWLADPFGNLILVYPPDFDQAGLHDDLKRLLRLSRIG